MTDVAIASGLAASALVALWAVSVIGWVRTRSLRRGVLLPSATEARPPFAGANTSRATYFPGLAGVMVTVAGGLWAFRGGDLLAVGAVVVGGGIVWAGFAARVTSLEIEPTGLTIRYQARRPFTLGWSEVQTVTPPRWPLGGWRLARSSGGRTLMGSDLLGHEDLLSTVIAVAAPRFVNGAWRSVT